MRFETFPSTVFLTGATGVLGARILKDLLQSTSSRIFCLARGDNQEHCHERVRAFLGVYDQNRSLEQEFQARVTVLRGDVTANLLGLDEETYFELQRETALTIHAAANTSLLLKYKRLEPINVHGTARVIEFCLGTEQKALSYVSTYTVMGDKTFDSRVTFSESDYDIGQGFEYLSYQRSKFVAEALVRGAGKQGLRWRIFRPGQIYGDSVTGSYPLFEAGGTGLFYDLFKTAIETQVMPESYIHYDVVPVDYVSRGIVALSGEQDSFSGVYHLTNPDAKNFSEVMALIRGHGYTIELLPEELYKKRLRAGEITRGGEPYTSVMLRAFSLWYFVSKISFFDSAMTSCELTRRKLEKLGVHCAPLDAKLIGTFLRAGVNAGYFPPALPIRNDGCLNSNAHLNKLNRSSNVRVPSHAEATIL